MKKMTLKYLGLFTLLMLVGCNKTKDVIREQIEWSDFWWENEPDTSIPRILFIGNSITRGYFPMVSANLAGWANCDRYASSRSITDPALLKETRMAMGRYNHLIIHFNNGLHGWHLDSARNEEGLRKYVRFLQSHKTNGCQLVYSLTTPVPSAEEEVKLDPVKNEIVLQRNRIARRIMEAHNIPVIDLYGLMEPEIRKYSASKGNVHYNRMGYERLAARITEVITGMLNENTAVIPVPKLEKDSFDEWACHAEALRIKDSIDPEMLTPDGTLTREITADFCHPTGKDYQEWADVLCL